MRTIILKREKNFSQSAMLFQVKCDGKLVATLRNGEEKSIEVDEEKHGIQCFADTIALDMEQSTSRLYSDLMDIPAGSDSVCVNLKPGFASIKMTVTNGKENAEVGQAKKQKKKFSIGIFLLLTLCTGIGGIIYAAIKLSQKD